MVRLVLADLVARLAFAGRFLATFDARFDLTFTIALRLCFMDLFGFREGFCRLIFLALAGLLAGFGLATRLGFRLGIVRFLAATLTTARRGTSTVSTSSSMIVSGSKA